MRKYLLTGSLLIVIGASVGIYVEHHNSKTFQVKLTAHAARPVSACTLLTRAEADKYLGVTSTKALVNRDVSTAGESNDQVCEYNQAEEETLIVQVRVPISPKEKIRQEAQGKAPVVESYYTEKPYELNRLQGFVNPGDNSDGKHVLASARFPLKSGSLQVNAKSLPQALAVAQLILTRQ